MCGHARGARHTHCPWTAKATSDVKRQTRKRSTQRQHPIWFYIWLLMAMIHDVPVAWKASCILLGIPESSPSKMPVRSEACGSDTPSVCTMTRARVARALSEDEAKNRHARRSAKRGQRKRKMRRAPDTDEPGEGDPNQRHHRMSGVRWRGERVTNGNSSERSCLLSDQQPHGHKRRSRDVDNDI